MDTVRSAGWRAGAQTLRHPDSDVNPGGVSHHHPVLRLWKPGGGDEGVVEVLHRGLLQRPRIVFDRGVADLVGSSGAEQAPAAGEEHIVLAGHDWVTDLHRQPRGGQARCAMAPMVAPLIPPPHDPTIEIALVARDWDLRQGRAG